MPRVFSTSLAYLTLMVVFYTGLDLCILQGQQALLLIRQPRAAEVFQHQAGFAQIPVSGETRIPGELHATVQRVDRVLPSWNNRTLGAVRAASWTSTLDSIPIGGPYRITLNLVSAGSIVSSQIIDSVWVGDIWVLAGQSNMVGRARLDEAEQPDPQVHLQLLDGRWVTATEPLHETKVGPEGEALGAGLGLSFAKYLVRNTGIPIGLIPCAKGASNISQWDPERKALGENSLYGAMLQRIERAGGKVAGVLWYQGEADARESRASAYADRFQQWASSLRRDLHTPELPIYYAQIGRFSGDLLGEHTADAQDVIREAQRLAEKEISSSVLVATIDLELEDHIHLNAASLHRLGRRFATVACPTRSSAIRACPVERKGPRLAAMQWAGPYRLRLTFSGVNVALVADGRVMGFSVSDGVGKRRGLISRAWIPKSAGNEIVIEFTSRYSFPDRLVLWYGRGLDPACNVRDKSDLALPTFGPVVVPQRPADKDQSRDSASESRDIAQEEQGK